MNQGARDANDEIRYYSEREHRQQVVRLLVEIRDLLAWHFRDDPKPKAEPSRPGITQDGSTPERMR